MQSALTGRLNDHQFAIRLLLNTGKSSELKTSFKK
jgi:hypothetical protein